MSEDPGRGAVGTDGEAGAVSAPVDRSSVDLDEMIDIAEDEISRAPTNNECRQCPSIKRYCRGPLDWALSIRLRGVLNFGWP